MQETRPLTLKDVRRALNFDQQRQAASRDTTQSPDPSAVQQLAEELAADLTLSSRINLAAKVDKVLAGGDKILLPSLGEKCQVLEEVESGDSVGESVGDENAGVMNSTEPCYGKKKEVQKQSSVSAISDSCSSVSSGSKSLASQTSKCKSSVKISKKNVRSSAGKDTRSDSGSSLESLTEKGKLKPRKKTAPKDKETTIKLDLEKSEEDTSKPVIAVQKQSNDKDLNIGVDGHPGNEKISVKVLLEKCQSEERDDTVERSVQDFDKYETNSNLGNSDNGCCNSASTTDKVELRNNDRGVLFTKHEKNTKNISLKNEMDPTSAKNIVKSAPAPINTNSKISDSNLACKKKQDASDAKRNINELASNSKLKVGSSIDSSTCSKAKGTTGNTENAHSAAAKAKYLPTSVENSQAKTKAPLAEVSNSCAGASKIKVSATYPDTSTNKAKGPTVNMNKVRSVFFHGVGLFWSFIAFSAKGSVALHLS